MSLNAQMNNGDDSSQFKQQQQQSQQQKLQQQSYNNGKREPQFANTDSGVEDTEPEITAVPHKVSYLIITNFIYYIVSVIIECLLFLHYR